MQSPRQVNGHGLGNKTGTGIEVQDSLPTPCREAGLFEEFAFCRRQFVFAFINAARAQLPQILLRGMTVLAYQKNPRFATAFIHCENYNRTRVADNIAAAADARGLKDLISRDPKGRAAVSLDGRKHSSFVSCIR
jgi:hypothetical protein